jgi:hypothetical protein
VIAPSRWIGYGDSGASPPTIMGLVSREMGAISALGGGGDLGISVDDAEVGGDVVILRSVLGMLFFVSRQSQVMRYVSGTVSKLLD